MITPKILKGFRDSLPENEIIKQSLTDVIKTQFRLHGFLPIDTPALEYSEILLGKGGGETDKQVFRFKDNGDRDVALRFDHTVPLARFTAMNYENLTFPLKCFQISKVWRGEKPQKGRFREFTQCDFDILGSEGFYSDFQILMMIYDCMKKISPGHFKIHISHRGLLNTYLAERNIPNQESAVLRALDKIKKISKEEVIRILIENGLSGNNIDDIFDYINITEINELKKVFDSENKFLGDLVNIFSLLNELGMSDYFELDTSITRGLDYYTGIVFETFLTDLPSIGSVCSGGRYDNLAGLYSNKRIQGVGASIGLDRLISAISESDNMPKYYEVSSDFLLTNQDWAFKVSRILNRKNIKTDIYCGNKSLGHQYAYAEALSIPFVISKYNSESDSFTVKDIKNNKMIENIKSDDLAGLIK